MRGEWKGNERGVEGELEESGRGMRGEWKGNEREGYIRVLCPCDCSSVD